MAMLTYHQNELFLEGISLTALAAEHGTPLYVYSQSAMLAAADEISAALVGPTPHLVCYAVKANPSLAVIQTFARQGLGADVTSSGELFRALRAGVPSVRIVYSGVGKLRSEMEDGLEAGIKGFHAESQWEIKGLSLVARRRGWVAPVCLRVNPDIDPQTHPHVTTGVRGTKFGLPWEQIEDLAAWIGTRPTLRLIGLSMHLGSQITGLDAFKEAAGRLVALARELLEGGAALEYLDLGGGLGVKYLDEEPPGLGEWGQTLRAAIQDLPLELVVEPGRALVAGAGVLLTRVLGIKHNDDKTFVIVDTVMNDLIRPMLYGATHPIWSTTRRDDGREQVVDVVGPVCETTDTLAHGRAMVLPHPGDVLAVLTAGAYGMSMASNYNSRRRPAEVMILTSGAAQVIRNRETLDDLIRGEHMLA